MAVKAKTRPKTKDSKKSKAIPHARRQVKPAKRRNLSRTMLEALIRESPIHPAADFPPLKPPFELQAD
jgi:hypothetical protein